MPPVVSIVGKSKSGKTAVMEMMAQEFGVVFSISNVDRFLEMS